MTADFGNNVTRDVNDDPSLITYAPDVTNDISTTDSYSAATDAISGEGNIGVATLYLSNYLWVLFIIIGVVGIVGNSVVAIVLLRFTNMRRRLTNIYVINQSLIDLVASFFLLLTTLFQDQSLPPGLAGEIKCQIWLYKLPFWASMISSSINLVALTVERYLKIVHPIVHHVSFTKRRAIISVIAIWVFGYVYNLCKTLPTSTVYQGQCLTLAVWPSLAAKRTQAVIHFMLQYLIPIVAFIFCYTRMAITLRRGSIQIASAPVAGCSSQPPPPHQLPKKFHHHQQQPSQIPTKNAVTSVVRTMFIVSVTFAVCLSTNQWLFFFYNLSLLNYNIYSSPIYPISIITMYLNCCLNPIIYASSYQQFREAVTRFMPKAKSDMTFSARRNVVASKIHADRVVALSTISGNVVHSNEVKELPVESEVPKTLNKNKQSMTADNSSASFSIE